MGTDLTVVNAARASFAKESKEFSAQDGRLLSFLARNGHSSPFRHCFGSFEVHAPLEIARQWFKYVTGQAHTDSFSTSWNESSRRYVTEDPEFYVPNHSQWRLAAESRKQGSGGPVGVFEGELLTQALEDLILRGEQIYKWAINELGVAPEMARLFLPAYSMYVTWRWSTSLQGLAFFLNQRMAEEGPQSEIRDYANAVYKLSQPLWPISIGSLVELEV
jgi:thymidylate synthase (FAD)